jgi:hypothetical protein
MNATPSPEPNVDELITRALADVWGCSAQDVVARLTAKGGDAPLSAKEGMAVGAIMEELLGGAEIFTPNDFAKGTTRVSKKGNRKPVSPNGCMDPAEDTSVLKLKNIICGKLGAAAQVQA